MPDQTGTIRDLSPAQGRSAMRALLSKEWHEQRWRFILGTIVLTALLAGLVRAEVIPRMEAAMLIYWPVGLILVIFLAMGPVAVERSDRTWEFLVARPISRMDVIKAKWLMGLLQLVGMMTVATLAGVLAMWSRGFRMLPPDPYLATRPPNLPWLDWIMYDTLGWLSAHPTIQLCVVAIASTVALACWFTPLFLILTRARNEFAAALGGILLTIAVHAWLAQFFGFNMGFRFLIVPALFNPLAGLIVAITPGWAIFLPVLMLVHVLLWIVLPLRLMRRRVNRGGAL